MSGSTCDVCNKKDYNAGVCCSSLGAVSFSYCLVCLSMGAEQQGLAEEMFPPGSTKMEIAYYKNDSYYKIHTTELIPIKLKSGKEFKTRQEVVDLWESKKK